MKLDDLYITLEDGRQYKLIPYVVCPLCGLNRKINKNGRFAIQKKKSGKKLRHTNLDKDTRFDRVDFKNNHFFSFRVSIGRGGIVEVLPLTIEEAINHENPSIREKARDLAKQIYQQASQLKEYLEQIGVADL
jgi:hypothetical protein